MKKNRSGAKHSRGSKGLHMDQRRRNDSHEKQQAGGPKHRGGDAREDRNP
jgi:hypothetical protein